MNPELWKMVCEVMDKILDVPAIERNEKIKALCDGVDGLEDEVRALLAVEEKAQNIFENVKLPDREDLEQTLTVAAPAKQFKQYSKLEKIGAGGMGVVYKARDVRLGREVALKFLSPQLSDDENSRRRFLTEAKAISKIDHPNVCVILDFGESADNQLYFTMPFYQGKTLKEHMAERPLSIAKVIDVIIQVTRALQATHAQDVIHRDIKPANVLITNEGVVKVLDFGIAKVPDAEATLTGQAIGTVSYMAPEQIHAEPVDNRADIWSVGVMFYELLATEKPFPGKSNLAISNAITRCDFKSLRDSIPTAPAILDRIVAKTLSANPDGRYQHVDELLTDLEKLQTEMGETERRIPARQSTEGRNIRRLATFGAALVVVITAFMIPAFRYAIEDAYDSVVHRTMPVRGVSTNEIRVGMTAAFSGPARELGRSMQVGIEARFREINEAGGIHGRTLQLKALDDRYEPVGAKKNLQQFFDPDDGVFVLLGNVGTPTAEVILPEILSNETVLFGTFSGSTLLRNVPPDHYVFNYRASYAQETAALVHYFVEVRTLDPKKIAVFYQNDSYGHDGLNGVVQALRQLHIHDQPITATYARNTAQVDQAVSAFITHRDAIDAIIIIGTYQASALFTQGMKESGYSGEIANVSFVGSRALIEEFNRLGKALGAGVLVSQVVPFYDSHAKGVLQYREALTRYFPSESPNFVSLEGYIVASIFCEALERNGRRLDTKSLITSLENIRDYDLGIGPTISFRPSRHQASQHVWGSRITQEGELESVELMPTTELRRHY